VPRAEVGLVETTWREISGVVRLFGHRDVGAALGAEAIVAASFSSFSTFIGVAAVSELGLTLSTASLFIGSEGLAYILAVFFLGGYARRLGYQSAALIGLAVSAVSLIGITLSPRVDLLIGFSGALGAALGSLNLASSMRAGTLPGEKGKIAALFSTAACAGVAVGPVFAGVVAECFGSRAVFIAFVPLYLALAVFTAGRELAAGHNTADAKEEL
jgi:MFS family permease